MKTEVFLPDTSIWIHFFRQEKQSKTQKVHQFFRVLPVEARLVTTGIILAEFVQGLGKSKKDRLAREILERCEYLPAEKEIYLFAGEVSKELAAKGFKTPLSDCLIAATAIAYGATLVTNDVHFKRFKNLKLEFIV